jgi:hypothetical protein
VDGRLAVSYAEPRAYGNATTRWSNREYHVPTLLEVIPKHVDRFPRSAADIFADVRRDYGEVTDRTLWRALKRLCHRGVIEHIGTLHGGQYRRAKQG